MSSLLSRRNFSVASPAAPPVSVWKRPVVFTIYDPTRSRDKEERAHENVLTFFPSDVSVHDRSNFIGQALGLSGMAAFFADVETVSHVITSTHVTCVSNPTQDLFMAASIEYARSDVTLGSTSWLTNALHSYLAALWNALDFRFGDDMAKRPLSADVEALCNAFAVRVLVPFAARCVATSISVSEEISNDSALSFGGSVSQWGGGTTSGATGSPTATTTASLPPPPPMGPNTASASARQTIAQWLPHCITKVPLLPSESVQVATFLSMANRPSAEHQTVFSCADGQVIFSGLSDSLTSAACFLKYLLGNALRSFTTRHGVHEGHCSVVSADPYTLMTWTPFGEPVTLPPNVVRGLTQFGDAFMRGMAVSRVRSNVGSASAGPALFASVRGCAMRVSTTGLEGVAAASASGGGHALYGGMFGSRFRNGHPSLSLELARTVWRSMTGRGASGVESIDWNEKPIGGSASFVVRRATVDEDDDDDVPDGAAATCGPETDVPRTLFPSRMKPHDHADAAATHRRCFGLEFSGGEEDVWVSLPCGWSVQRSHGGRMAGMVLPNYTSLPPGAVSNRYDAARRATYTSAPLYFSDVTSDVANMTAQLFSGHPFDPPPVDPDGHF